MSTIDEDIARLTELLAKAPAAVPSIIAEIRKHVPEEAWPIFDAKVAPILEAADPTAAATKFASGFAGILQSFQQGHGETGMHSPHAG